MICGDFGQKQDNVKNDLEQVSRYNKYTMDNYGEKRKNGKKRRRDIDQIRKRWISELSYLRGLKKYERSWEIGKKIKYGEKSERMSPMVIN